MGQEISRKTAGPGKELMFLIQKTGIAVALLAVAGCGYVTHSALPSDWRTIHVASFANKIDYASPSKRNLYLPLLEIKARDAIINRFAFDGSLKIREEDEADLILQGELINYERGPLRFTDVYDVQEYRIRVIVNLKLTEGMNGPVVWQEKGFAGEATYFVSGPRARSESAALDEALTDLARRTVERTLDNW